MASKMLKYMRERLSLLREVKSPFRRQTGYKTLLIRWLLKIMERGQTEKMEKMAWMVLGVSGPCMTTNGMKKRHSIVIPSHILLMNIPIVAVCMLFFK